MNKKIYFGLLFVCMLVYATPSDSNQFIKERRTKKVSVARLKEEIGELLGSSLMYSTDIVTNMGKIQRELMQMMAALMEQPKDSRLTQADRLALDKTLDELVAIECDLSALVKRLSQHAEVVKKQY